MYITLICHSCKKDFTISLENFCDIRKCPKCNASISLADSSRLYAMSDPVCINLSHLEDVSVKCIYPDSESDAVSRQRADSLYSSDINELIKIYRAADLVTRELLSSIMDKIFLLVYHDAKDGNSKKLQATYQLIHDVWIKKTDLLHDEMGKTLE